MSTLQNKYAMITGSTRGFGYAVAAELLKAGARVEYTVSRVSSPIQRPE